MWSIRALAQSTSRIKCKSTSLPIPLKSTALSERSIPSVRSYSVQKGQADGKDTKNDSSEENKKEETSDPQDIVVTETSKRKLVLASLWVLGAIFVGGTLVILFYNDWAFTQITLPLMISLENTAGSHMLMRRLLLHQLANLTAVSESTRGLLLENPKIIRWILNQPVVDDIEAKYPVSTGEKVDNLDKQKMRIEDAYHNVAKIIANLSQPPGGRILLDYDLSKALSNILDYQSRNVHRDLPTQLSITRYVAITLGELGESEGGKEMIKGVGVKGILFLLDQPIFGTSYYNALKPEQSEKLYKCCTAISEITLQQAKSNTAMAFIRDGGMKLLNSLSQCRSAVYNSPIQHSKDVDFGLFLALTISQISLSATDDMMVQIVDAGALDILSRLSEYATMDGRMSSSTMNMQRQVAKAVNEIASCRLEPIQLKMVERNFLGILLKWIMAGENDLYGVRRPMPDKPWLPWDELDLQCSAVSCVAYLGFGDASSSFLSRNPTFLSSFFRAFSAVERQLLLNSPEKEKLYELQLQYLRAISNLTLHEDLAADIWIRTESLNTFLDILRSNSKNIQGTIGEKYREESARKIAKVVANFTTHDKVLERINARQPIYNDYWWHLITELSRIEDIKTQRQAARAMANWVSKEPNITAEQVSLLTVQIKEWIHADDFLLTSEAMRARATLLNAGYDGPKYSDGVYLLYPLPGEPTQATKTIDFDIVFIHGVTGHYQTTWVQLPQNKPNEKEETEASEAARDEISYDLDAMMSYLSSLRAALSESEKPQVVSRSDEQMIKELVKDDQKMEDFVCWPRDWMPGENSEDCLGKSDEISETFPNCRILSISYDSWLTKWSGNTLPLQQQSEEIIDKLKMAQVGERPVIFVVHSFGGLVTKEMMRYASTHKEYRDLLENTLGIVFFSTPHRDLIKYAQNVNVLFRATSTALELYDRIRLEELNDQFQKMAPHISTLSFGEGKTCLGPTCFQVVSDESSNPGFVGSQHTFQKLDYNHREICKPINKEAQQYQMIIDFVKKNMDEYQAKRTRMGLKRA
ncbi:protein SERAC1-like [Planoprotostelium fungivorum]|uniref:Protein SERAC1 n=1 Tax=Planoprotostelium fungivorum TaxID=1890364 RepID=A0A2P6NWP6_9EUKA|nr:protein SERAC1-like [Planoprotostelium fungivorum]